MYYVYILYVKVFTMDAKFIKARRTEPHLSSTGVE